jgi:outer membrane biosynthesis protein TonB
LEERRSYWSFASSATLHGALLALILFGFASAPKFADSPEAIPVETLSLSELNQIANGEKEAKPVPQPAPTPPEQPADLRASTEPPTPQPAPPPKPAPAPLPKAESAPPPKPAQPPKAEATPPPEPEPMPPERPEPPPPLKLAIQDTPVEPPVRPKFIDAPPERQKEPTPEKPKPSHNFDPNMIAKLIGQGKTSTPAIAATQTAAATPQGLPHHDAPHMSMSLASALDAWLTESYLNCWTPPPTMPDGDTYVAEIRVIFNPDGSLSGHPVLLNPPTDRAWRAHAESAMRAVRKCDPLKVPAQYMPYFEQWKVETIHFDPRETQG